MFNRKAAILAALTASILAASGALAMLTGTNRSAHSPTPAQIDALDLMSKATGLVDQKIENLF